MAECDEATMPFERTGRKYNITSESTGKVYNSTIVSAQSPNFMKGPFESNRGRFDRQGICEARFDQRSRRVDHNNHAGGLVEAGKPATDKAEREQGKRTQIVHEDSGKLFSYTNVSDYAPDFVRSPFTSNQSHFGRKGLKQHLGLHGYAIGHPPPPDPIAELGKNEHLPTFAQKGSDRERRPGDWTCLRSQIVHEETGQVNNHHTVSPSAPDFMKPTRASNLLPNREHPRPRAARRDGEHSAGLARAEACDHVWGPGHAAWERSRRVNIRIAETGELRNNSVNSMKAPDVLHEPFESNRDNYVARNLHQSIHTYHVPNKVWDKENGGSKRILHQEPTQPRPDFLIQTSRGHRRVHDAAYDHRRKVDRQRHAGNTRCFVAPSQGSSQASRSTMDSGFTAESFSSCGTPRRAASARGLSQAGFRRSRGGGWSRAETQWSEDPRRSRSSSRPHYHGSGASGQSYASSMYGSSYDHGTSEAGFGRGCCSPSARTPSTRCSSARSFRGAPPRPGSSGGDARSTGTPRMRPRSASMRR